MIKKTVEEFRLKYRELTETTSALEEKYLIDGDSAAAEMEANTHLTDVYTIKHGDILHQYGHHVQHTSTKDKPAPSSCDALRGRASDAERFPAPALNGNRQSFGSWKHEFQQWLH